MSGMMQATRRGRKHRCGACGAAFYDLEHELTACPKCETLYGTSAHMSRGEPARKRSWSKRTRRPEIEAAPEAPAAEVTEEENEGAPILDAPDDSEQAEESNETAEDDNA